MDEKVKVKEKARETLEDLKQADELANAPLVAKTVTYPLETLVPEARQQTPAVGQRVTRPDGHLHGLGQTKYIDDLTFPNMIHAKILRSEHAHARILNIDTSEAEKMPGVLATLTGKEIPVNSFGPSLQDQPVLADEMVFHMGDGVAAVAALTEQQAADALAKIKVDYEPLPAVFDPLEAMQEDAPKVHYPASNIYASKIIKKGDVEKALAEADRVFEKRFTTQMVEHVPLEPHCSIALWDPNGRLTLWSSLGRITLGRSDLARTLNMPMNKIRVAATIVGGNFGGKNEITSEPILALLSKKTGRPVKGTFTRRDEFVSSTTRHPFVMDFTTGVSNEGRLLARKVRLVTDGGAYCSWSETTLGKAAILSAGPYKIDHLTIESFAVYTNKTMTGAMRGFGAPQVCFAYESHMDDIAHELGIDPLEIRMLNAFDEDSPSPTGQVLQSVVVKESLIAAADRFGWKEWQQ
jgi:CO/xanthine dehydrogenase Mo-binding subunit